MRNTTVINFFGAPGSGKSTLSSGLFHNLKVKAAVTCELVTEYSKELVWEQRSRTFRDQLYISAKQNHRLMMLKEQVEVIVTDSPLLQGLIYDKTEYPAFPEMIAQAFNSYNNINFLVYRNKKYSHVGRNQSETESDSLATEIKKLLQQYEVGYTEIPSDISIAKLTDLLPDLSLRTITRKE